MHGLISLLKSPTTLRRVALANVVANVAIVVTGGAVRLTGSGMGCPTWPRCTEDSFAATAALGIHGTIEYGNRLLTPVVGIIAAVGVVLALLATPRRGPALPATPRRGPALPATPRRGLVLLTSVGVFAAVAAQAVLGGITVRTTLDPLYVGAHFLLSMVAIAATFAFWRATREPDGPVVTAVASPLRALAALIVAVSFLVLGVGTLVTGAGPHAGDVNAERNSLDPEVISQVHADIVFLLLGLTVAAWFALRAAGSRTAASRCGWLVVIIMAQGIIGFVQYFTSLPVVLVGLHMAGACAVWLGTLSLYYATRTRISRPVSPAPTAGSPPVGSPQVESSPVPSSPVPSPPVEPSPVTTSASPAT